VAAAVGATGSAQDLTEMTALEVVDDPIGNYPYRDWEDLYREEWDWDGRPARRTASTARAAARGRCTRGMGRCGARSKPATTPDSTSRSRIRTRGAVRRACFSDYVNADQRVTHPLRRTGERGEGSGSGSPGTRRSPRSPRRSSTPSRTRSTTRSAASPRSRR